MSSREVDYDALAVTTSVEEIADDEDNWDTLRSLKNDDLPALWLCAPGLAEYHGDYVLRGSTELGWLGHFVKKSTRLESFGIHGHNIFDRCSEQSVERFFGDLGLCNHIKKMEFIRTDLDGIFYKLGPVMKNNNMTDFSVKECCMGVPGTTFLFNTLRDMNSLEELCIDCGEGEEGFNGLDDGIMTGCIPSLAACTGMRKLTLNYLSMSTRSCSALSAIFPRMSNLLELDLSQNSIDDGCVEVLVRGLAGCSHLRSLRMGRNRIGDNGLDVLIQGLPASVYALEISYNEITLSRQLPLLRFKLLSLSGNAISSDGARVIAESLANSECHLESLYLCTNAGDEGVATLAESLRSNQRLTRMSLSTNIVNITETGWRAFSPILCDTTSIDATYNSNHTLQYLGGDTSRKPQDVEILLELNSDRDKSRVAANKILRTHRHLDMRPLFDREMGLLPSVVAWLERFAKARLDLKLSALYEFVRAMPMKVTDRVAGKTKGKKRKLDSS